MAPRTSKIDLMQFAMQTEENQPGRNGSVDPHMQSREGYYADYAKWAKLEGLDPSGYHTRRSLRANPGVVANVQSLEELEKASLNREVKGAYWNRREKALCPDIVEWVQKQPEDGYCAFGEQRLVVLKINDEAGDFTANRTPPTRPKEKVAGIAITPHDLKVACNRLVEKVPDQKVRRMVKADAETLAKMLMKLCPDAPFLALQLEIIGNNRCSRWHQDIYAGRMLITYTGPSTWMADDHKVNFEMFEEMVGVPNEISDPIVVPDFDSIHKPPANSVVLVKGNLWPGIDQSANGMGVVHKSPNMRLNSVGYPTCKRMVLKVDLSYTNNFE